MLTLCTLWLSLASGVPVEVSLPTGQVHSGELVRLATEEVAISSGGQEMTWPTEKIRRIRFPGASAPATEKLMEAQLTDGSVLLVSQFQTQAETATVHWVEVPSPLSLPVRALRCILFTKLSAANQAQWDEWLLNPPAADAVIVQRKDGQLQSIEGIIEQVTDENVRFQFDGDVIDVKRHRVIGLLYFSGANPVKHTHRASIRGVAGGVLRLRTVQALGDQLELETGNGTALTLAMNRTDYLDFAVVSVTYLSDLEPESQQFAPYLQVPAIAALEQKWFAPQRDQQISRQKLSWTSNDLTRSAQKGLGLHSQSELVYRLAGEYRRLVTVASLDATEAKAQVAFVILIDGQERLRQDLATGDPPLDVDLDITGANRLTIRVDYGDPSDQGDHVSLCDARLLK